MNFLRAVVAGLIVAVIGALLVPAGAGASGNVQSTDPGASAVQRATTESDGAVRTARTESPAGRALVGMSPMEAVDIFKELFSVMFGGEGGDVRRELERLSKQIEQLSVDVRDGFNQLEVDIANTQYAAAQNELRPVTTRVNTAYRHLITVNSSAPDSAAYRDALKSLRTACDAISVDTEELLQMYSGDPADGMSQSGLLPAAWQVLVANERSIQGVRPGAEPPYLSHRTVMQMRRVGEFSGARITQYAAVRATCDGFDAPDAKEAADDVRRLVLNGSRDAAGLKSVEASLPAALPRLTGVFTGRVAGDRGLVVGNFSDRQRVGNADLMLVDAYTGLGFNNRVKTSVPSPPLNAGFEPGPVAIDGNRLRNRWLEGSLSAYSPWCLQLLGNRDLDWNPRCTSEVRSEQVFRVEDGQVRVGDDNRLCLTVVGTWLDRDVDNQQMWLQRIADGALPVDLRRCDQREKTTVWMEGPMPTLDNDVDARMARALRVGSPLGDNLAGDSAGWSTSWRYMTEDWLFGMREVIQRSGTTPERLSAAYGSQESDENVRALPPVTPRPAIVREAFPRGLSDGGPAWLVQAEQGPSGERRIIVKQSENNQRAFTAKWADRPWLPAASTIFAFPVDSCAFTYERPVRGGFTCKARD